MPVTLLYVKISQVYEAALSLRMSIRYEYIHADVSIYSTHSGGGHYGLPAIFTRLKKQVVFGRISR